MINPSKRIMIAPPMAQVVHTMLDQTLFAPPSFNANSREPSASVASAATVMAVPSAMAKVAATPAQNSPCVSAKTRTRIAPVHGLMPTENTTAITLRGAGKLPRIDHVIARLSVREPHLDSSPDSG